jgi:nucleotide-binding universal stress UspA family protein
MNMNIKIEIKKILCPVDFSGTSSHATRYAVALAEKFDSELVLLHVEEPSELAMANYYGVSSSGFGLVSTISSDVLAPPRSVASEKVTADELDKVASELQTSRTCRISLRRRFGKVHTGTGNLRGLVHGHESRSRHCLTFISSIL